MNYQFDLSIVILIFRSTFVTRQGEPPLIHNGALNGHKMPLPTITFGLGDVVRKVREQRQLTLRALAALAGVNYSAAGRLENDPDKSERRTIERVAAALGTTPLELMTASRIMTVSAEEQELVSAYRALDQRRQEILLEVARREFAAWSRLDREQGREEAASRPEKANGST